MDLPPTNWLVEGIVPAGGFIVLYGESGIGKGCESRMAVMSAAWFVEFRQRLPWLLHVD